MYNFSEVGRGIEYKICLNELSISSKQNTNVIYEEFHD